MFKEQFEKLIEGRDITSTLRKEFPKVIFQLIGPSEGFDNERDFYRMQMILVPFELRNQGIATKFMERLVELMKHDKFDVFLTPDDGYQEPGEMTKSQLVKFYKKLGFVKKHKDDFRAQDTYCFYSK